MTVSEDRVPSAADVDHSERRYFSIGIAATIVWAGFWLVMTAFAAERPTKLNEWGDFVGGITGPIVLGWLVLGYLQTSKALVIDHAELRAIVKETRQQQRIQTTTGQPRFATVGRRHSSEKGSLFELKVTNSDNPAGSVTITGVSGAGEEEVASRDAPLHAGDQRRYTFERAPQLIRISYVDIFGRAQFVELEMPRPAEANWGGEGRVVRESYNLGDGS